MGESGGEAGRDLCILTAEDVLRSPNPNLFPGFGGRGGGWSSELRVLPVLLRAAGGARPLKKIC